MNTSFFGNFSNRGAGLPKLVASTSSGFPGNPIRTRKSISLINPGVEADENAGGLVANVLQRVPVPLRNIADVSLLERFPIR